VGHGESAKPTVAALPLPVGIPVPWTTGRIPLRSTVAHDISLATEVENAPNIAREQNVHTGGP